jgi:hypothetical protein
MLTRNASQYYVVRTLPVIFVFMILYCLANNFGIPRYHHTCRFFIVIWQLYIIEWGTRWRGAWGTALQTGSSRDRFSMLSLEFFIDIIRPAALWPWGSLSLSQKWGPEICPGEKVGRWVGLTTLPSSCAECLKICEPQRPGTLRACQRL